MAIWLVHKITNRDIAAWKGVGELTYLWYTNYYLELCNMKTMPVSYQGP